MALGAEFLEFPSKEPLFVRHESENERQEGNDGGRDRARERERGGDKYTRDETRNNPNGKVK